MTVYYQFGTKRELLEALFDHVAARGRLDRLNEVFQEPDALAALAEFIEVFCGFWATDPEGLRRLRGWATLEATPGEGPRRRDVWRREGLTVLVNRIRDEQAVPEQAALQDAIDMLYALTSFETYEYLAQVGRGEQEVSVLLQRTARAILGLN
jgi:AcrR family transcriptional regulator